MYNLQNLNKYLKIICYKKFKKTLKLKKNLLNKNTNLINTKITLKILKPV